MANTPHKTSNKKPKLVRDSFTIPKAEYVVIEDMKVRAIALGTSVKKSELLRAGLKLLQSLGDSAYKAALAAVPALKTGRPAGEAPAPEAVKASRTARQPVARKTKATTTTQAQLKNAVKTPTQSTPHVVAKPAAKTVAKTAAKAAATAPLKKSVKAPAKPAPALKQPVAQKVGATAPAPAKAAQPKVQAAAAPAPAKA